jgi:hypothetical protein
VAIERPTSDPSPAEPSWVAKRSAELRATGLDAETARRQAEEEGRIANASPGAKRDRDRLTPTEPDVPVVDSKILHRWHEKIARAQGNGREARHCHGPLCMAAGEAVDFCRCTCSGCALITSLYVTAHREILAEGR